MELVTIFLVLNTLFLFSVSFFHRWFQNTLRVSHGQLSIDDPSHYRLSYSPTSLPFSYRVLIVLMALLKYLPRPLGYKKRLVPNKAGDGIDITPLRVSATLDITPSELAAFSRALKSDTPTKADFEATSQNPLLLVSLTTPLLLIIFSHPEFALQPLGAVNTRNRFTFCDPAALQRLSTSNESSRPKLSGTAETGACVRVRRGIEITILVTVHAEGEVVLTQELSFLQFLRKSAKPLYIEPASSAGPALDESQMPWQSSGLELTVGTNAPKLWAASCMDYNPIHVSPLLAKLFGFPSVIAHGNFVVALVVQMVRDRPRAGEDGSAEGTGLEERFGDLCWSGDRPNWLEVKFRKPMVLPVKVDVRWKRQGEDVAFEVCKGEKGYFAGSVGYL